MNRPDRSKRRAREGGTIQATKVGDNGGIDDWERGFRVKNEYIPAWRKPTRHPQVGLARAALVVSSLASLPFLFVAPKEGYALPISMQLARGETPAWLCMSAMVATMLFFARNLWAYRRHVSAIGCVVVGAILVAIASTNPLSSLHLQLFVCLAFILLATHWILFITLGDWWIMCSTVWLVISAFVCFAALGIGERMMIVGSVVTINVIVAEYLGA